MAVKTLVLMKGLPGSGKSTLSRELAQANQSSVILSTDEYFMDENNNYRFNALLLGAAHTWNQNRCREHMQAAYQLIIIDNTNVVSKEARPYVDMAKQYGYTIKVVEPNTWWAKDVDECVKRNTHNVPRESISRMAARYQSMEEFCKDLGL